MHEWPEEESDRTTEVFLVNNPPRVMAGHRVCVAFACKGMLDTMRRYADSTLAVSVEGKQGCMAHGWVVLTCSVLVKDKLRRPSLGRSGGRKVQGSAFTTHALPLLQAMTNIEQTENVHQVTQTLKRLWACPNRPELGKYIRQIHKDWLPCLDNARVVHFSHGTAGERLLPFA